MGGYGHHMPTASERYGSNRLSGQLLGRWPRAWAPTPSASSSRARSSPAHQARHRGDRAGPAGRAGDDHQGGAGLPAHVGGAGIVGVERLPGAAAGKTSPRRCGGDPLLRGEGAGGSGENSAADRPSFISAADPHGCTGLGRSKRTDSPAHRLTAGNIPPSAAAGRSDRRSRSSAWSSRVRAVGSVR